VKGRLRGTWLAAAAAVLIAVVTVLVVLLPGTSGHHPAPRPAGTVSPPPSAGPPSAGPATPAQGVYFGAWVSPTVYAPTVYTQRARILAVDALQRQIGRRLDIVHIYLTQNAQFPTSSDLAFVNQGSTLLVSWALNDSRAIAAGQYDGLIKQRAQEIKEIGKPVFLEWRWEMNRPNLQAEVGSPADYIAAWKHIRDVFAGQHVTNVAWVWCPTAKGFTDGTAGAYYPGDSEVDWICADVYPPAGPLNSFSDLARPFLNWAAQHAKPVMIGEYGVWLDYSPQERAQWLRDAARTVAADRQIKALVYFDGPGQEPQSSTVLSGVALQAFRGIADARYFNPKGLPLTPAS
jgi:hypothetical protein